MSSESHFTVFNFNQLKNNLKINIIIHMIKSRAKWQHIYLLQIKIKLLFSCGNLKLKNILSHNSEINARDWMEWPDLLLNNIF